MIDLMMGMRNICMPEEFTFFNLFEAVCMVGQGEVMTLEKGSLSVYLCVYAYSGATNHEPQIMDA